MKRKARSGQTPSVPTGAISKARAAVTRPGFDFTLSVEHVCRDMARALPEMSHINCDRIAFCFSQARNRSSYGIFASLTPLRSAGGSTRILRRGRPYNIQRVLSSTGVEILYILTCYLPRFMDLSFREKLITLYHEMWHIGPTFDGDMRRHEGRCYAHTHSQKEYDAQMGLFVDQYLSGNPSENLLRFLELNFDELHQHHGPIIGQKIPRPKLIPAKRNT